MQTVSASVSIALPLFTASVSVGVTDSVRLSEVRNDINSEPYALTSHRPDLAQQ